MSLKRPLFKGEILIFEDNETNQQFIKSILLKVGFNVVIANNGKEGVNIVSNRIQNGENQFDLIFMDMYMPEMDGLNAAETLKKLGVKTPIVVMTSNVTAKDKVTYNAHGLSEILEKPFSMEEMWSCLYKYFTPLEYKIINENDSAEFEEERCKRLFTRFVKNNQTTFQEISSAIDSGDIKLAHRLTHTLGGLAGLMGKVSLYEVSRNIENTLAKGSADGISEQIFMLERELNKVLDELSPLLDEPKPRTSTNKVFDEAKTLEVFGKLETLLQTDNAKCIELIKELTAIPDTESLIMQIEDYEFEKALETLSYFKESLGKFDGTVESDTNRRRILVVDDEVNNIDALCQILMPLYDVIVAKNGCSAIQKAKQYMPDIILLDIIMQDITGFEVISDLKSSDETRKIPIIFITGLSNNDDEEKGLMLGAVDYITKPFRDSIVKARVHTHLQNVEYINTIERLCMVDTLTNIPNRRGFDNRMLMEWGRAAREKKAISILMFDVDHFKKYNDTYGHLQGDTLLKAISSIFKQSLLRPADFVSRWGGEEFSVILTDTDMEGALQVAERIRKNIEHSYVPCADGTKTNVTISIGINTEVPLYDKGKGIEDFINKADKALYNAKSTGRNRVQHYLAI